METYAQEIFFFTESLFANWLVIFLGILILGDIAFVPAIYFAVIGDLNFVTVLLASVAASVVGDTIWYVIGRYISRERLYSIGYFAKKRAVIDHLSERYMIRIILISNFLIAIRVAVRIFLGMQKVPYWKVIVVDILGTTAWKISLAGLVLVLDLSLGELRETTHGIQIGFLIFISLVALIMYIGQRHFGKRWIDMDPHNKKDPS